MKTRERFLWYMAIIFLPGILVRLMLEITAPLSQWDWGIKFTEIIVASYIPIFLVLVFEFLYRLRKSEDFSIDTKRRK